MSQYSIPSEDEMYRASLARDSSYEGIFITAVKTTGIFCRPSCPAKKPHRENVEFFSTPLEAMQHGYRACKRCTPLQPDGDAPAEILELLETLEAQPTERLRDHDLRNRGMDPSWVRRWFKRNYGVTFHAYQRAQHLGQALQHLNLGAGVTSVAFDNGYESLSGFQEAIRQFTGRSPSENRDTVVVNLSRVLTPLGPMLAGVTHDGICLLEFMDRRMLRTQLVRLVDRWNCTFAPGPSTVNAQLTEELDAYFSDGLQTFSVPLITQGTAFQEKVWEKLRAIPYGQTRSYRDLARRIGKPEAVRAVGRANGDNRIAIIIPCHRVIGSDGSLTGYGGGLWRKRWLLRNEGALFGDETQLSRRSGRFSAR
jgi:AraC family transcriptional regulator of adaptative response/methylated-DNA-[protein]-cysteine methyltransferase